ncbi:MAG: methyltransferase domain-containing protein [Candidatus Heimdallarchaeota archaeon]
MHGEPDWEKIMITEKQYPNLNDIEVEGLILDIGGGGEGIIGQLLGDQVISIDKNKRELEEAPSDNLKLVMDATDLQFIDESFNTATVFFTFMYLDKDIRKKVMKEIYRVLKPGGKLLVWDVVVPSRSDNEKHESFCVFVSVTLPNKKEINTGYGTSFKRHQTADEYKNLAKEIGFKLNTETSKDQIFYLEFSK